MEGISGGDARWYTVPLCRCAPLTVASRRVGEGWWEGLLGQVLGGKRVLSGRGLGGKRVLGGRGFSG